jgi:hypothetical protein
VMDLSLVSTENLITEILERVDHGIVSLMRTNCGGDETNVYTRHWTGNSHTCCGLADDVKDRILSEFREGEVIEEE